MRTSLFFFLVAGCASEPSTADADADTDVDSDADTDADTDSDTDTGGACAVADEVCPASHPHPGGPCVGDLVCEYPIEPEIWTYTCIGGRWNAESNCLGYGDDGCVPPLVERCDDPFAGEITDAAVEIGPADSAEAFRPFGADDVLALVWGSQGSPMVEFRVRVSGVEVPPECVFARYTLTNEAEGTNEPTVDRMRMRCGESLATFAIVPFGGDLGCSATGGTLPIRIDVEIQGVGTGSADVTVAYGVEENCWG